MNPKVKKAAVSGMFAAMIFVLTMFVKFPVASGYVHFGDALVYLCALYLGAPWALIAGALGEGLADIAGGYVMYAPATVIVKILIAIPFIAVRRKQSQFLSVRTALMTLLSGVISVGGYFIADLVIDKAYAVVDIPGNLIQALGSAVIFILLAAAFDKAKIREKFSFEA